MCVYLSACIWSHLTVSQLSNAFILSNSQWGSREKLSDLFKHTEKVWRRMGNGSNLDKSKFQIQMTMCRACCACATEPNHLLNHECKRKSHEENHKETSHNHLDLLMQNQDLLSHCWLLANKLQWFRQGSGLLQMLLMKDQESSWTNSNHRIV